MSMEWILLGTGAADWQKPRENGEYRGYTSCLLYTSFAMSQILTLAFAFHWIA